MCWVGSFTARFPHYCNGKSLSWVGLTRERWCCAGRWLSRLDMNTCQMSIKHRYKLRCWSPHHLTNNMRTSLEFGDETNTIVHDRADKQRISQIRTLDRLLKLSWILRACTNVLIEYVHKICRQNLSKIKLCDWPNKLDATSWQVLNTTESVGMDRF